MKIYEFDREERCGVVKIIRTREITPAQAVLERVKDAARNTDTNSYDAQGAAIEKLCEMVAVLITRLPPELADEALDYAYDIEG